MKNDPVLLEYKLHPFRGAHSLKAHFGVLRFCQTKPPTLRGTHRIQLAIPQAARENGRCSPSSAGPQRTGEAPPPAALWRTALSISHVLQASGPDSEDPSAAQRYFTMTGGLPGHRGSAAARVVTRAFRVAFCGEQNVHYCASRGFAVASSLSRSRFLREAVSVRIELLGMASIAGGQAPRTRTWLHSCRRRRRVSTYQRLGSTCIHQAMPAVPLSWPRLRIQVPPRPLGACKKFATCCRHRA